MATVHSVEGFDPLHLTSEASLNRTRLADLHGADPRWVGRPAFEALSTQALEQLAAELGFGTPTAGEGIARSLSAAFTGQDQARAVSAAAVAEVFGQRLAHLIATLVRPAFADPGHSPWRAAYLRHWSQVERVWLGGGLAAALGSPLVAEVRKAAVRLGAESCAIELATYPSVLALIGAARSCLRPRPHSVVLDFGHSSVKRGVATVHGGQLESLQLLPSRGVPRLSPAEAGPVVDFVLNTVRDAFRLSQRRREVDRCVVASVASYLVDGRPVDDARSLYSPLGTVDRATLEETLEQRTGAPLRLSFIHDGTAAARGLPESGRAAVILLGTSLGVGFPPSADRLLPMSVDLVVRSAP